MILVRAVVIGVCGLMGAPCFAGKWNQPGGTGSPVTITYSYGDLLDPPGLDRISGFSDWDVVTKIEDAFQVWANYVPITFVQVKDGGSVNIRIYDYDLSGSTVGQAALPPNNSFSGSLWMRLDDSNRTWGQATLRAAAAHEFGHNLGLGHYDGSTALMNPGLNEAIKDNIRDGELFSHDISAIQDKYGAGTGEVRNTRYWKGPVDSLENWTVDENWRVDEDAFSSEPAFRPTINSNIQINRGAVLINSGDRLGRKMFIGQYAGETGRLKVTGGTLTLRHEEGLCVGVDGSGTVQHFDGTVTLQRIRMGGSASNDTADYQLEGGTLKLSGDIDDTGPGYSTFSLEGGDLDKTRLGDITVDCFAFGGTTNEQILEWDIGNTLRVKDEMKLGHVSGKGARLVLRSGTLRVDGNVTGGSGTGRLYIQGGSVDIAGSIAVDELQVANYYEDVSLSFGQDVTADTLIHIGGLQNGTYTQTGGRVETASLQLAGGSSGKTGTYNLNGGALIVTGDLFDGGSGTSVFNHNGGQLAVAGDITVDAFNLAPADSATYVHTNNQLTVGTLTIGGSAHGTMIQQAGTVIVSNSITGNGRFILEGGVLDAGVPFLDIDGLTYRGGVMRNVQSVRGDFGHEQVTWSPGDGLGCFEIGGNYTAGTGAVLHVEIGGFTAGVDHDVLRVAGDANLSGCLKVTLSGRFLPRPGERFSVLEYGSRTGAYVDYDGLLPADGLILVPEYEADRLVLTTTVTGDPNDVDGDLLPNDWELAHFGNMTTGSADADTDGDGHSNYEEYIADTDPVDSDSRFEIQIDYTDTACIRFNASTSRVYTLQSSDVLNPAVWQNVPGRVNVPGSGPDTWLDDPETAKHKVYRVGVKRP